MFIFSILFSFISEGVDKENVLKKSIASLVSDHFLHSCYVNVSLRGDTVRRNYILITLRDQRVKGKKAVMITT